MDNAETKLLCSRISASSPGSRWYPHDEASTGIRTVVPAAAPFHERRTNSSTV